MPDQPAPATDTALAPERSLAGDLRYGVSKAASWMQEGRLTNGDLAALRRIAPERPFTPALWRLLIKLNMADAPDWMGRYGQPTWERRWATLFMALAHAPHLHDPNLPLGRALAEAGWSELRLVRLLRAEDVALEKDVRRVAHYLSSKSQPANTTDIALLLFYQNGTTSEQLRLDVARTYYRSLYTAQQEQPAS